MFKKTIPLIATLSFSLSAFASGVYHPAPTPTKPAPCDEYLSGVYIGIQGGLAWSDVGNGFKNYVNGVYDYEKDQGNNPVKQIDEHDVGGRAFVGYNFNPYVALELGGTLYPENKYGLFVDFGDNNNILTTIKTYTFDLLGKFSLPLGEKWSIYAKAGIAYVNTTYEYTGTDLTSETNHAWRPGYGAGASYSLSRDITVDFAWIGVLGEDHTQFDATYPPNSDPIFRIRNANSVIPTCNLIAIGLTYKFPPIF